MEGNPEHPESLGAAGAREQASLLGLYDPYRARVVRHQGEPVPRAALFSWLIEQSRRSDGGAGLRLLVEPSASPFVGGHLCPALENYPRAKVVPFSSIEQVQAREGTRLAFGGPLQVLPRFAEARTVVSLDDDFLSTLPGSLRSAREFATARARPELNRLWVVESHLSITGAFAVQPAASPALPGAAPGTRARRRGGTGAGTRGARGPRRGHSVLERGGAALADGGGQGSRGAARRGAGGGRGAAARGGPGARALDQRGPGTGRSGASWTSC